MIPISTLVRSIKPSATLAAGAKAKKLQAEGKRIFDFSLGEPDFNTPAHINAAADAAAKAGQTHYTPSAGIPELRKAVCQWYAKKYNLECKPEEVLISAGAKHSIHNALVAVLNPGDEVIIPAPYWVSYSDLVAMTGAIPVVISTKMEDNFKMSPAQFRAAITPKTRLVMLNSPSNPTGCVYTRSELEALVDIAIEKDLIILSDEIYEQLTYGTAKPTCVVTLRPGLKARTITISGASKSYAMTGWRMGWTIAPAEVINAMNTVQSQETGCPTSISQYALLAALSGPQECVEEMRQAFEKRKNLTCRLLRDIPGITFPEPEGAFYVFFNIQSYFGKTIQGYKITDSVSFCNAVLEGGHVNFVPGSAFGSEGFARISFATSEQIIEDGLLALKKFLAS